MKRGIAAVVVLTLAGIAVVLAYMVAARQREYRALIARGDAALRDDQTFAAIEAYSGAIALRSDSMLAHLRLAETYHRRGDLDEAAREFRRAATLDPTAPRPLEELGDVAYQQQRFARSADAYERALALDDRSARVTYKLAMARYRNVSAEEALQAIRQTLTLDSQSADSWYLFGLCLRDAHKTAEAVRAFEKAVFIAPGLIPAREELADLYGALNRPGDEIEQLQLVAGLDGNRVSRQIALGLAHHRAGHGDLAVLTLGSALEGSPGDPDVYRALGRVWIDRARSDPALLSKAREALAGIAANPAATSDTLTLYGEALLEDGELDDAARVLEQAMARFPVDPGAFAAYATVAERQKRPEAAERARTRYELLRPDF